MERVTANVHDQILLAEPLARRAGLVALAGIVLLGAAAGITLVSGQDWTRFLHGYLVAVAFCMSIVLGALFFVILHHVTGARWSVSVRRLAEHISANIVWLAVAVLPILFSMHSLYEWTHADVVAHDPALQHKEPYLNLPFFLVRTVIYFSVWIGLTRYFFKRSAQQDATADPRLTVQMRRRSPLAMILLAFTLTFFSFDYLMSLDPHWFSTIFGVYYFAGSAVAFFAALALTAHLLQRAGCLSQTVTSEHYHDVGKFMFAFIVFWAYIAFSQYMLIWYGNIPEETGWLLRRQEGGWEYVSLFLLFGHFVIPFVALLSRHPKRRRTLLAVAASWILFMHWCDLYWLVMPQASTRWNGLPLVELLTALGLLGVLVGVTMRRMRRVALLAHRDPFLSESMVFENF